MINTIDDADLAAMKELQEDEFGDKLLIHICESCGKTELLTPDEAFKAGWDYPPRMGAFGILSPRTCPTCTIYKTVYWELTANGKDVGDLSRKQQETIVRILNEPESIMVR